MAAICQHEKMEVAVVDGRHEYCAGCGMSPEEVQQDLEIRDKVTMAQYESLVELRAATGAMRVADDAVRAAEAARSAVAARWHDANESFQRAMGWI